MSRGKNSYKLGGCAERIRMADPNHLQLLLKGAEYWNDWCRSNPMSKANLFGANLSGADLTRARLKSANLRNADLSGSNLSGAILYGANLYKANLTGANLNTSNLIKANLRETNLSFATFCHAKLKEANLSKSNLRNTDLTGANLYGCDLSKSNLREARLVGANLRRVNLVGAILEDANLSNCSVYGLSAWDVQLEGATQTDLVITPAEAQTITVDNVEVAQFIYLLLNNKNVRHVIDTITSKVVLILGRFTPERMAILDAIRDELRNRDYLPVLFDFDKPANRDITETVSTLAHMARFVVADITDAKSIPQELMRIVPALPSVPVQPLLLASQREYGMFEHFKRYPWMLPVFEYDDQDGLLAALNEKVIAPAEAMARMQTAK